MARINEHYQKLQAGYLFPEIGRRVKAFSDAHPDAAVIRLGIGDVTLPLAPAIVEALRDAASREFGTPEGFHGYGPENGYDFLVDPILEYDFEARGVELDARRGLRLRRQQAGQRATSRRSSRQRLLHRW